MRESQVKAVEGARQAILARLHEDLPGPGEISVDAFGAPHSENAIFLCQRSNRIGVVILTVALVGEADELADRAMDELMATQLDALEAPLPGFGAPEPPPPHELVAVGVRRQRR